MRWAILAALQVGPLLGLAAYHEHVRATAPTFRIPLRPVDPHDLLRGRYFTLNPVDASLKAGAPDSTLSAAEVERFLGGEPGFAGVALAGFCPRGSLHRVCALSPRGEARTDTAPYWARAFVRVAHEEHVWRDGRPVPEPGWRVQLDLGLHRFFIPDRLVLPAREAEPGWNLEVAHRPGSGLLPRRLFFRDTPVAWE